ncbi:MAG: Hsp20/alpha crystallin family protein [Gammaproteobacteria bacterium]
MAEQQKTPTQASSLARHMGGGMIPEEIDRCFDDFFSQRWFPSFFERRFHDFPELRSRSEGRLPKVDVIDRENEIILRAELPGVSKDNLDVSLSDNTILIRASTRHEAQEEKGGYYRREMSRGEFQRTIPMPANVKGEKAKASFKDGILELTLPKLEQSTRRAIKVE